MSERLRPRDLAFLELETPSTPRHNATVEIFDPGDSGFDYDRFVALILDRISFVPRYRQRVQAVPGHLATPVWVDDEHFDIGYHVRRSALPRPGTTEQLRELVSRIVSRPLDRGRPLWEIYFVEGLADGRVALLYKTHQALVDGVETVDLGQVLLDKDPGVKILGGDEWHPHRHALERRAAGRRAPRQPHRAATPRSTRPGRPLGSALRTAGPARVGRGQGARRADRPRSRPRQRALRRALPAAPGGRRRRPRSPTTAPSATTHGGTINDVILATLTGGLRAWLMTRSESMGGLRQIQAVVPVSVIDRELEATSLGSQIAPHFVDLPIGEASPVVRLHQVSYSFQTHKDTGRGVAANRLAGIAGFAPDDVPRDRLAGRRRGDAPRLPALDHQRARPAVAAVRRRRPDAAHLPDPAAAAGPDPRDRRDVVRRPGLLRHHRRPRPGPRRRRPRPVRDRGARPSCSTPRPAAGRRSRAAGARRPLPKP